MTGTSRERIQRSAARLQKQTASARKDRVPATVPKVLQQQGRPLDGSVRGAMESRFDHDFSKVRIHTDQMAAESARDVDARAYTVGAHIVFGSGEFSPSTAEGQRLLAHELTHVVQQGDRVEHKAGTQGLRVDGGSSEPAEVEAGKVAASVMAGGSAPASISSQPVGINRDGPLLPPAEEGFRFRNPDGTPMFQLRLDPLLMPPPVLPSLELDPEIAARIRAASIARAALSPTTIRTAIQQVPIGTMIAQPRPPWLTAPPIVPAAPLVPRGAGPTEMRAATGGDVLGAITAIPAVESLLDRVKSDALNGIENEWNGLNTGERVLVVSHSAIVLGTALTGILANAETRNLALGALAGRDLPIPGIPMTMQLNLVGPDLGVRFGLNVGALLPSRLGFK